MSSSSSTCFKTAVLALILVLGSALADESDSSATVTYNTAEFKEKVPEQNHFVMFYAPWCGHCKRLHPTWDQLAKAYNNDDSAETDVIIAKVDCTVEVSLCSDNDVTGYPTLKFFKKGSDEHKKYRGQRDVDSLTTFIKKQLGLIEDEEAVLEPEIAQADKGLYVLNSKSFTNHVKSGDHFVKFYAPWCGHCQKLAPIWDELAEKFAEDKVVKVAKLDCTTAQNICQDNDVKGYPTLAYFKNGKKVETYKGGRNLKDLSDFLKSMQEAKTGGADKKEKVPEDPKAGPLAILNADNFEASIKSGVSFVKFFAPWCGHCKRLSPTWDDLAKKFADVEGVTIAKVDCTADDNKNKDLCNDQGVNGFPTLNLYKDGKKVDEYNGKRNLEDLVKYVEDKSGAAKKDEL